MQPKSTGHRSPAVALALLLMLTGCAGLHDDLCEHAADCGGGSEAEIDACIADLDRREELADIYGCEDLWDDYTSCLDAHGYCDENGNLTGCDAQRDAFSHCVNVYERGKAKVESEPGAGTLEPAAFEPAGAIDADAPKPKKAKCSLAEPPGHGAPPASWGWLLLGLVPLGWLRRRRG